MRRQTILMVARALDDAATGINSELAGIAGLVDGTVPEFEAVLNEIEHNDAGVEKMPDSEREEEVYPCVLVSNTADLSSVDPHLKPGPIRDGSIDVLIRIGIRENQVPGTDFSEQGIEAAMRVLDRWILGPEVARLLDGIYVIYCELMEPVTVKQSQKDALVSAALRTRWRVRNTTPLGA